MYFIRVGGLNWNTIANYVFVTSTKTADVMTPTGLFGTAQGISSITWTWGSNGADSYKLYMASSPTTVIYSGSNPFFPETGLSTNTAYGRMVTAVVSGIESPLSAAVTTYTNAAVPGQPAFTNV